MDSIRAGHLLIVGSAIFLIGAAVGVPGVFTESDPEKKLRMLDERLFLWRLGQPFYALGPIIASVGVGDLARTSDGSSRVTLILSALLLILGALCWSWSVYLRATRHRDFALGALPGWPFGAYVALTIGGLTALGAGLLLGDYADWMGWLTLGMDLVFLAGYLRLKDIPPFVFYLLLAVVGAVLL